MSDLDLDVNFVFNTPEAIAEAERIKNSVASVGKSANKANGEQIGILERLKAKLKELQEQQLKATSTTAIEKYNIKIQEFQKEIDRLNKIGKQGFDDMGNAIPDFKKPTGLINRMTEAMKLYAKASKEATNPEIIAKYNAKLQQTQIEITKLKNIGKQGFDEAGNAIASAEKKGNGLLNGIKSIGSAIGIAFTIDLIRQWGMELFGIANTASGIERAFSAIGGSESVQKLRKETKGFVSDLELEKLTVQAKNLNVPIENLGTYLAFAAQRAKDTGGDVQQLTNDIINGLGRESPRVIDNLGISQKELNKEIAKTGDFSKAVANIMARSMNDAGVAVDTLADKTNRLSTWWSNLKTNVAGFFAKTLNPDMADNKVIGNITEGVMKKVGNFSKVQAADRAKQITEQIAHIKRLSEEYTNAQKKYEAAVPDSMQKIALARVKKESGEILAAAQNVLKNLKDIDRKQSVTERQGKGVYNINELDEKIDKLTIKFRDSLDPKERANLKKQIDEATKLRDEMEGKKKKEKVGKSDETMLNQQRALQQRINDLRDEYNRKSLNKDEAEIQAVRDKFEKISKEIAIFNKNPKNRYKVDGSGLDETLAKAIEDLKYKQQTERLKVKLDEDKQLYADYENYKAEFGEAKAKERFGAQIKTEQSYLQQLQAAYAITYAQGLVSGFSGKIQERLSLQGKAIKAERQNEEKKNDEILKDFEAYADKRVRIQEKYLAIADALRKQGREKEAQTAIDKGLEELTALDKANIEKWTSYKRLFDNIEKLSRRQTLSAIAQLEKELKATSLTNEAKATTFKKLNELKEKIRNDVAKDLEGVVSQLGNIASEFSNINGNIGNIANVLLTSAKGYLEIKKGIKDVQDPDKSTTEKVGAGLGIVGAAISVGKTIFGYFKGLKEAKEAAKKAMADYHAQAKKGELEYQELVRKRELDDIKRGKNSYRAIIDQLELLKKQSPEIKAAYDKIFASMQGQSYVSDIGSKHGTWLRKAKTWDVMASLGGADYAEMEKLYLQGKLKDQAKADFESLRALKDELKNAGIQVEELQNQLNELLTGTNVSGLADGLQELFENGKFAAQDFGNSFEQIMRKAINNSFKEKLLKDALEPFYKEFSALFVNGTPNEAELQKLKDKYIALGEEFGTKFKELEKITGKSLTDASKTNSLSGALSTASQDSINVLSGHTAGMRLAQLEGNQISRSILVANELQLSAIKSMHLTQMQIEINTKRTAEASDNYLPYLKNIADNTKDALATQLRAAGKYGY